jgi:hypothetical protein
VSLPDDVVGYLDSHPETAALVIQAVRANMERAAKSRAMLEAVGFRLTEQGRAWARSVLQPLTDEQKAEIQRRHELITAGRWAEI